MKALTGQLYSGSYATDIGIITVKATSYAVVGIVLPDGKADTGSRRPTAERRSALTDRAAEQICEYLDGRRESFDLPVFADGTEFQMKVWSALRAIPYGQTRTYADIAAEIGKPGAVRAVGGACGANPCPIIIPCHRVVAKNGIGGFSAGDRSIDLKAALLSLERKEK